MKRGDPEIGSDIIASTAGQPTTYRTTATGLKEAVTTQGGTNGGWFDTAAGESSKSQSVAFEQSEGHTKEFTFNIDAKGGGGAGGFKFGLSGGSSAGSSASTISTEGIERSGTRPAVRHNGLQLPVEVRRLGNHADDRRPFV